MSASKGKPVSVPAVKRCPCGYEDVIPGRPVGPDCWAESGGAAGIYGP